MLSGEDITLIYRPESAGSGLPFNHEATRLRRRENILRRNDDPELWADYDRLSKEVVVGSALLVTRF